jgi:ferrous iron transport protein A
MDLSIAEIGREYIVENVATNDEELNSFLFSLGCYKGEPITVIAHKRGGCIVAIKDARYNIDKDLAKAIKIKE